MIAKRYFITILIDGQSFDLPSDMPIPRVGETVLMGKEFGVVTEVRHIHQGKLHEVRLETTSPIDEASRKMILSKDEKDKMFLNE